MTVRLRASIFVALLALSTGAQTQDAVQLGTKTVRIPPPEGFAATFARFSRLRDRFAAGQNPGTSVVEVYVPANVIGDLAKNEDISLSFYSGLGIPDASRVMDSTAAEFRSLVGDFERQHDTLFDARSPAVLEAAARVRRGVDSHFVTSVQAEQPTSLGYLEREPRVFSGMILQPVETKSGRIRLLIAFSFVHLNGRIVYLQFYRKFVNENDPAILRDSITKWTAAILAANE